MWSISVKIALTGKNKEESHRGLHHGPEPVFGNKVQPTAFVAKSNNFKANEAKRGNDNS
nr:hypothetical protein [Tanacetum cinerariifolium]